MVIDSSLRCARHLLHLHLKGPHHHRPAPQQDKGKRNSPAATWASELRRLRRCNRLNKNDPATKPSSPTQGPTLKEENRMARIIGGARPTARGQWLRGDRKWYRSAIQVSRRMD